MILSHKLFLLIFVPLASIPLLTDAQIIKRKSKSDFKAPVIYTLHTSSDTSGKAAATSKTNAEKDSTQLKKDSAQEAILKLMAAIQNDVSSIKNNQISNEDRHRERNYSNRDSMVQTDGYRRRTKENYRTIPDSTEKPRKTDSLKGDDVYQRKLDSLQQRIDMLQKKKPQRDTLIINKGPISPDTLNQPLPNLNNDSLAAINTRDSLTIARKMDSLTKVEYNIKRNNDSMAVIQKSLKEAKDSANYYRRLAFAAGTNKAAINTQANDTDRADTAKRKTNVSQRTFKSKNDKEKISKEKNNDQINTTDSSSANIDRNIPDQRINDEPGGYYDERAVAIDRQLKDLQEKNEMLGKNYDQLKMSMQVQENQNRQRLYESREYYDNNYDSEISSLRNEIKRVKDDAARDNRSKNYIHPPITYISQPATTRSIDTVYMAPPPVQPDSSSIKENDEIMEEINTLRIQMDSMKKSSLKTNNTSKETRTTFEPASYPITSLYFKMGAASVGKDQNNKIARIASVAKRNPLAIISLTAFTDPVGNSNVNAKLANSRLRFVQEMLIVKYEIDASRIVLEEPVLGEGSKKPNPMERRVDIQFQ